MTLVTMIALEAELTSRWAIGAIASADDPVKSPIMVDPRTRHPVIPGSSIAGSLRRHLGDLAEEWLGKEPGEFEDFTGNFERKPGRLALLGSRVEKAETHSAGSTAVDPRRGAADGHTLRQYEWATGSPLSIAFQHDGAVDKTLVARLCSWHPYLGAGRSAGFGETEVSKVHTLTLDLAKEAELEFWLGPRAEWYDRPAQVGVGSYSSANGGAGKTAWAEVSLEAKEPLAIGDGRSTQHGQQLVRDVIRLTPQGAPLIPGQSWRGVFRHRIHTILSAIGANDDQCGQIIDGMFGSVDRGRGPLWFGDSPLPDDCLQRSHVAIDRFTGGARQGALFKVKAVRPGVNLTLRYRWERGQIPPAVANLINHVLRDLHDGLASVGGMGTRGYGWVTLTSLEAVPVDAVSLEDLIRVVEELEPTTQAGTDTEGAVK